jgi:hypothetical protein
MLPKFPIKITFDIANCADTREVWAHPQARTLALLWRPFHIVNQHFWGQCLTIGRLIAKRKPQTTLELRKCLSIHESLHGNNFTMYDIRTFSVEALPYFTGTDVPFEVGFPNTERTVVSKSVRRVYVASSWRNEIQPVVVSKIRAAGHEVYDFRNPKPGNHGFHWHEIDQNWKAWDCSTFRNALQHPLAETGFALDWTAMEWADSCILVMPCGRSAHIEAGYFRGAGKRLVILLSSGEPELMYKMAYHLALTVEEAVAALSGV